MNIATDSATFREMRRRANRLRGSALAGAIVIGFVGQVSLAGMPQGVNVNVAGTLSIAATGDPLSGPTNFRFILFDLPIGGSPIATLDVNDVQVAADGKFNTVVDFGSVDFSDNLYLQIEVDVTQTGSYSGTGDRRILGGAPRTGFALVANNLQWPISATVESDQVGLALFYDGASQVILANNSDSSSTSSAIEGGTNGSGAGVKGKNTGTGAGVEGEVDNQQSLAPAIRGTSNGSGCAMEVVNTGLGMAATFSCASALPSAYIENTGTGGGATISCTSTDYALYVENNGAGKSIKAQDGMDVMGRTTMVHGQGFQRTLEVQNTSANGTALLAYNQNGGTGGFFSSIGGTGCTVDATGATSTALHCFTSLGQCANFETTGATNAQSSIIVDHAGTGACIEANASGTGAALIANGHIGIDKSNPSHPIDHVSGAHLTNGGVFTNASSRALKENFTPVNARDVLAAVRQLPISRWNYRVEESSVQHMGPVAEDFSHAFGLGGGDRSIGTVDADGVALAAIQGLGELLDEKDRQIAELTARLAALEAAVRTVSTTHGSTTSR